MNKGYYSQPAISKTHIAFISDDDLWTVERNGGTARRLTANKGLIASPCFSPDGRWIAYVSTDSAAEGDIYLIPSEGGESRRLTWLGVNRVVSWKDASTLYFTCGLDVYPGRQVEVYELDVDSCDFKKVGLGPSSFYFKGKNFQVLARHSGDSARWKRYQGGTAGVLWVQRGAGKFQRILKNIKTNVGRPEVIAGLIYFISDHEGVANVYRCDLEGRGLTRLTHHLEYYCRHLRACEDTLVYQAGAEIYTLNLQDGVSVKADISCATPALQAVPRFELWTDYFHGAALGPQAAELTAVSRGHVFRLAPFSGPVRELDSDKSSRYSWPCYTADGKSLLAAGQHGEAEEKLFSVDLVSGVKREIFTQVKWGKIWGIRCAPKGNLAAVITNKNEVLVLDLKKNSLKKIETNAFNRPADLDWSPDGRYLAYTAQVDSRRSGIRIYDSEKAQLKFMMEPVCQDFSPSFDPEGRFLYFLGIREFAPNYNETHFDLGFPFAVRPYAVSLSAGTVSPFEGPLINPKSDEPEEKKPEKPAALRVEIDFAGIEDRVLPFGLELGGYSRVVGVKGGMVYLKRNIVPIENHDRFQDGKGETLYLYKFEDGSNEVFQKNVSGLYPAADKAHFLVYTDSKLRLLDPKTKPTSETKIGKKDGYVDGTRIRLKVDPRREWIQMYHEAWVLQKEHFWRKDLSKIDWKLVYERYEKILPLVKTRHEFSDLMWEMQGELGTSHCYEMMGDYDRLGAGLGFGRLGAYFSFNPARRSFRIEKILKGDSWAPAAESPLSAMGVSLREQDEILAVDGVRFSKASDLYEMLENKGALKVELTVKRKGAASSENVVVKTARALRGAWYRDWVTRNKDYVHKVSKGKLGYVHIPDMGSHGYAEFYRHFASESRFEGLVVDVRFNGGGHVSQHLLKVLAQKVLGFDETRYQGVEKYPSYAVGTLVALANEHSGSDGDIFPHSFKLMKLGKLIGKRTWGGIIGINGQYSLRDGTWVTQPEYSFWFKDNEWFVENHGVDPDIEVDIAPEDYREGRDPQLDRGIAEALKELKARPGAQFRPSYYPDLSIPSRLAKLNR